MEQEVKKAKINKKQKRLIISLVLCLFSLTLGVVSGIKIASIDDVEHKQSQYDQLVQILNQSWRSDIYYGNDADEKALINQFIGALSTSDSVRLDPYTYLRKKESSVASKQTGKLGITLSYFYNYPVIIEVDKDGACYKVLKEGDIVTSLGKIENDEYKYYTIIDDKTDYSNIFEQVLGMPNDKIMVKVARFENNILNHLSYEITLKEASETKYSYVVDENIDDTLMVKLTGFTDSNNGTATQLEAILKKDKSKNLIIDLRDNGGGDLSSVIDVCDLFLPKNILVTTLEYKDGLRECKTYDDDVYEYEKICVLQNENTASASEILISTLLYYFNDKVTLIGSKSYGKGIAQSSVNVLNNQYILQYTCAKWLRPDNSWIGMTIENQAPTNYFMPTENYNLEKSNTLKLMEANNGYIFYKENVEDYLAFNIDKVAYQNQYFFEVYNSLYNKDIRTDRYFDNSCSEAIKEYQTLKGINVTGTMNQDTFLHFVYDFYCIKSNFSKLHLDKVIEIVGE